MAQKLLTLSAGGVVTEAANAGELGYTPINKAGDTGIGTLSMGALTATTGAFSSTFAVNTNDLYVDVTNHRVGMGTASPNVKLHLYGTSPSTRYQDTSVSCDAYFGANAFVGSSFGGGTVSAHPYIFVTNSSERMRITSAGKVGIQTTAPEVQLGINSQIDSATIQTYTFATSHYGFNGYYHSGSPYTYTRYMDIIAYGAPDGTNGASAIRFLTNPVTAGSAASERLRVDSAGAIFAGSVTSTTHKVTSAGGYISSDGSTGYTGSVTTASLVGKTLTIKDGIITGFA